MDAIYNAKAFTENNKVFIKWDINPEIIKNEPDYYFEVFRSNTDSDYIFICETRINNAQDKEVNIFSKWREFNYIIRAKKGSDIIGELKVSLFRDRATILVRKMQLDFNKVNGLKLKNIGFVISEISDKKPCPECYDENYNESTDSECKVCGGIGFLKMYSDGVKLIYAKGTTPEIPTTKKGISETENAVRQVKVIGTIPFHPGDIFIDRNGKMHRIENLTPNVIFNCVAFQGLYVKEMDRVSPEYKIKLDFSKCKDLTNWEDSEKWVT